MQEISLTNQANRLKLEEPHCTGTKSFARIIDEKTKDANGIPPSRAQMYILSRTKKDGTVVNQKAAEFMAKMKERIDASSNSSVQQDLSLENDVYFQVKGPEKKRLTVLLRKFLWFIFQVWFINPMKRRGLRIPEENVNDVINEAMINQEMLIVHQITRPTQTVPQIQVINPTQTKEMNDED
ncbi:Transposase, Ptta/En/Spm, plant [Corchorus olitorius]|uniref:Transposase, Ptta/En/Spm, plant n=1 Tax=Corchorus olitorius TaxID=93759 RepID=A0A1R3KIJ7_9ROSI|nr:Transposase, Ptta/En/Spm, plant [Corchorus olitorius]